MIARYPVLHDQLSSAFSPRAFSDFPPDFPRFASAWRVEISEARVESRVETQDFVGLRLLTAAKGKFKF
jgi:hypothetical protein